MQYHKQRTLLEVDSAVVPSYLVEALQQDEALATTTIIQEAQIQPPVKRVKRSIRLQQLQSRLLSLCTARRAKKKTVVETLVGLENINRF